MAFPNFTQGTKVRLGTLFVNGAKQLNPTRPWNGTPTGPGTAGNIPTYSSGAITIGDSDSDNAYKIQWVPVLVNGKWWLIADRNILCAAPWNTLNDNGFVSGVTKTIDGVQVKLRLLTGGTQDRTSGSTGYAGGTPTNNDWDKIIQNEGAFSGLPTPTAADKDSSLVDADYSSTHNQYWNWYYEYSWMKETYEPNM